MTIALLKQGKTREALFLLQDITRKNLPLTYEDKMFIAQSFGAAYSAMKQYNLAEKYYLKSVAWSNQSALQFHYIAWKGISQFYVASGQYAKAEPFLKKLFT